MNTKNYKTKKNFTAAFGGCIKLLAVSVIFFAAYVYAQPAQLWVKTYNNPSGTGNDFAVKSVTDADGNIYIASSTGTANTNGDIMLVKYSQAGTFLWSKTYNYVYNGIENPNDITLDNSGNIYVTGTSTRAPGSYDCILLKFNSAGNILWVKRINRSNYSDRQAKGVSLIIRDGLYIGVNFNYNGYSETGIAKYSFNGDSLSFISTGFLQNYSLRMWKMVQDNSLNLYVICSGNIIPNEEEDFLVKKINTNGELTQLWNKIFTGSSHLDDRATDIAVGPDGNIFITGYTTVNNQAANLLLLKMGRDDGSIIFQKSYNNAVNNQMDYGEKIVFDNNSNIIVSGGTYSLNAPSNLLLIKYSPAGSQLWTKIYDHSGATYDWVKDTKTDNSGNIYLVADCFNEIQQTTGLLTAKFSSAGELDWFIERSGQTTSQSMKTLELNADGTLVAAANTDSAGIKKILLIKYGSTIGIEPVSNSIPEQYSLSQNYPNPFNPSTNIKLQIPEAGNVKLTVFDVTGSEVALLVNENLSAGEYKVDFNAAALTSGVYFYRLETAGFKDVKKMILVK